MNEEKARKLEYEEPLKKCKKPFKKILKISKQDILKFLSGQGYNIEDYKLESFEMDGFSVHVTLGLIEVVK